MDYASKSFRNGNPVFIQGWARIIRSSNRIPVPLARMQRGVSSFIRLDGELLTIHEDPHLLPFKSYDIRGAVVEYNEGNNRKRDFRVSIGTRVIYITCDEHKEMLEWVRNLNRAAARSFERFYLKGNRISDTEACPGGTLYIAYDIRDVRLEYTVKCVETVEPISMRAVDRERRISERIEHRCVLRADDMFRSARDAHFVYRRMSGGSVRGFLHSHGGRLPEAVVQVIAHELLGAIRYLHGVQVAHLGVCPDAIYLSRKGFPATVALGSFGSSEVFSILAANSEGEFNPEDFDGLEIPSIVPYIAPEIVRGQPFGPAADLWAAGATLYELVCGVPPFGVGDNSSNITTNGSAGFIEPQWSRVSESAMSLVRQLLSDAPHKRVIAAAAQNHSWFRHKLDRKLWTGRRSIGPLIVQDTPMMKMILSSGLVETRRADEERFRRFMTSKLVQTQLNIFFPMRRKLVVRSRTLVACFRLLAYVRGMSFTVRGPRRSNSDNDSLTVARMRAQEVRQESVLRRMRSNASSMHTLTETNVSEDTIPS